MTQNVQLDLAELSRRIANRTPSRNEATLQADVRTLIMHGVDLADDQIVSLEEPTSDGTRRRIDIAVGRTVIELKKDLRSAAAANALEQLAGYVADRSSHVGDRYVGVLTDGQEWRLYFLQPKGLLEEVSSLHLDPTNPDVPGLLAWIGAVLSVAEAVQPTPEEVEASFGASSPAYQLDIAEITAFYEVCREETEVQLKRELWAKLLTTAFGTAFTDDPNLFLNHTYLVVAAKVIAHAVIGLNPADPAHTADSLLSGTAFSGADITGVVEEDFFDWVLNASGGREFVKRIARRVARFDWSAVQHDLLKTLYESVVSPDERHRLGEYYTPDWLANRVVRKVYDDPLKQRALDPACGSGTFIFHAVRAYIEAAEVNKISLDQSIIGVTSHVFGVDVHPVAVTLARVTYLLAIGREKLVDNARPPFHVPIYLGDSLQWEQRIGLFGSDGLSIPAAEGMLFGGELRFPDSIVRDAQRFDQFVIELSSRATARPPGSTRPQIDSLLNQFGIPTADRDAVKATYSTMCDLRDNEYNHIWSYYVRNLVRPLWLARPENKADCLIGNPPWLAYRHMTERMQTSFRSASRAYGLWTGGRSATQQDLSAYFVVQAIALYLKSDGRFGFVLPRSTLRARQYEGFRTAHFGGEEHGYLDASFDEVWDLEPVRPFLFRVPSCTVFGHAAQGSPKSMPTETIEWFGTLSSPNEEWKVAEKELGTRRGSVEVAVDATSVYASRFYQGATFLPIVLSRVTLPPPGPLGVGAGSTRVRAIASTREPWSTLQPAEGVVESQFVRRIYESDSIAAFCVLDPEYAIVPAAGDNIILPSAEKGSAPLDAYPKMAAWWRARNEEWIELRSASSPPTLLDRVDYNSSLANQLPTRPYRVLYNTSGSILRAAVLRDTAGLVDHGAYWASTNSEDEAFYLVAVLNSAVLLDKVNPQQASGLYGTRHFHKTPFTAPIPEYSETSTLHQSLVAVARRLATVAESVPPVQRRGVIAHRRAIRRTVVASGDFAQLNELAAELLGLPIPTVSVESLDSQA